MSRQRHLNLNPVETESMAGATTDSSTAANPEGPLALSEATSHRISRVGHGFLADFLTEETKRREGNRAVLTLLSQSLSRLGRHHEGLEIDKRLVDLHPKHPVAHYNLACAQALTGDPKGALASLHAAVQFGFYDAEFMIQDSDLASLLGQEDFQGLVRSLRNSHRKP